MSGSDAKESKDRGRLKKIAVGCEVNEEEIYGREEMGKDLLAIRGLKNLKLDVIIIE